MTDQKVNITTSRQWQLFFLTAEALVVVVVYPLLGPGSGGVRWCCVSCESGFSVYIAGPGICVVCLADT